MSAVEYCDHCDGEMKQLAGEWRCPYCESLSGFTMTPSHDEKDSFSL